MLPPQDTAWKVTQTERALSIQAANGREQAIITTRDPTRKDSLFQDTMAIEITKLESTGERGTTDIPSANHDRNGRW